MIDSWQTNINENKVRSDFFNPMVPVSSDPNRYYQNQATKEDYRKYGWLFGPK
jgi:hypothetical protein